MCKLIDIIRIISISLLLTALSHTAHATSVPLLVVMTKVNESPESVASEQARLIQQIAEQITTDPQNIVENLKRNELTFPTFTWGAVLDASFIIGANIEQGVAYGPSEECNGVKSQRDYFSKGPTIGFSASADGSPVFGFWRGNIESLEGWAFPVTQAGAYGAGLGVTEWIGTNGDFLGFTVQIQFGLSLELETGATHTSFTDDVECGVSI